MGEQWIHYFCKHNLLVVLISSESVTVIDSGTFSRSALELAGGPGRQPP